MEQKFSTMLEDVKHDRSHILSLPLPDPDDQKQSKFTDREINNIKILALEKIRWPIKFKGIFSFTIRRIVIFCLIN